MRSRVYCSFVVATALRPDTGLLLGLVSWARFSHNCHEDWLETKDKYEKLA